MLSMFDSLREPSFFSIAVRMLLACICGGLIGLEREFKRRPAGFRTHILICLGAAITTLTSQYLVLVMKSSTDMARLGAQVIAGVGFIGAGTIIVTRHQRIKGLTTAAGLWASAIIGLALGAGFYEGGLFTTALILVAELLFVRLEYYILHNAPEVTFFMEYRDKDCLNRVLKLYQEMKVKLNGMEITRAAGTETHNACAIFSLRLNKQCKVGGLIESLLQIDGVVSVEEL